MTTDDLDATRGEDREAVGAAARAHDALRIVAQDRDDLRLLLDWLDERVGDGNGEVRLGLTENGGVGCWLPGDETVPEGESVEEAVRFRMERARRRAEGGAT